MSIWVPVLNYFVYAPRIAGSYGNSVLNFEGLTLCFLQQL
jgi:hypothetical protein